MRYLLLLSFLFLTACTSLPDAEKETPHADFITNKSVEDYSNCVALELGLHHEYAEANLPGGGKRFYKGAMGSVGFFIDVMPDENGSHVKAWIPSSGWALIPKRTLALVNKCR